MIFWITLVLCSLVSENFGQEDSTPETLEDRIKEHLDSDPTTKNILEGIYNRPMTDQFKGLLYLSLNNLLVSNEILASTKPEESPGLSQARDYIEKENLEMLTHLDTEEKREKYKSDYGILSNQIAEEINQPFDTQFFGGKLTSESSKESVASLLTLDELIAWINILRTKLTFPSSSGLIC